MKFRKKPVVIEAVQITEPIQIETLEGVMQGNVGDWLITGVQGEQYPCRADIFAQTYEPVDDDDDEEDEDEDEEPHVYWPPGASLEDMLINMPDLRRGMTWHEPVLAPIQPMYLEGDSNG